MGNCSDHDGVYSARGVRSGIARGLSGPLWTIATIGVLVGTYESLLEAGQLPAGWGSISLVNASAFNYSSFALSLLLVRFLYCYPGSLDHLIVIRLAYLALEVPCPQPLMTVASTRYHFQLPLLCYDALAAFDAGMLTYCKVSIGQHRSALTTETRFASQADSASQC